MNIVNIEGVTLGELKELYDLSPLTIREAMPSMHEFRDKHNLTDKEALMAFGISVKLFRQG